MGPAAVALLRMPEWRQIVAGTDTIDTAGRFLFAHGRELTEDDVETADGLGIRVVPSINRFHYRESERDSLPKDDCVRLRRAGVCDFQIDWEYAPFVLGAAGA